MSAGQRGQGMQRLLSRVSEIYVVAKIQVSE